MKFKGTRTLPLSANVPGSPGSPPTAGFHLVAVSVGVWGRDGFDDRVRPEAVVPIHPEETFVTPSARFLVIPETFSRNVFHQNS